MVISLLLGEQLKALLAVYSAYFQPLRAPLKRALIGRLRYVKPPASLPLQGVGVTVGYLSR